ncbi:hypothetical protein AK830_g3754 [Neonectria ditissima]|uniref:D-arabinitol 2-dehydrogenase [ribulose-forming] n=1 Tax=Neonectria ditissima TaxID=78410 RepID=A0A0N8H7V1_9HYPO|nr:hypothetical protein AK830_g3754 [Neonectria ditissima]
MATLIPKRAWRVLTPSQLSRRATPALSPITSNASIYSRGLHSSQKDSAKPKNPDPRENPAIETRLSRDTNVGQKYLADFSLRGKVFIVTGGAQGLGLALAEGLVEAGVYCFDRAESPDQDWRQAQQRVVPECGGSIEYRQQDVTDTDGLDRQMAEIAQEHGGLHGVIAAAGIQKILPAVDYQASDVAEMLAINYTGVMMTATSAARQMMKYKCRGSICLIASISGMEASKGLISPVYNSSKAAVIQLARNLAMEWSPVKKDGTGGIRVNCISPGHILTPMVRKNFEEVPGLQEDWEKEIMMGRLAETQEFKSAALFILSNANIRRSHENVDSGDMLIFQPNMIQGTLELARSIVAFPFQSTPLDAFADLPDFDHIGWDYFDKMQSVTRQRTATSGSTTPAMTSELNHSRKTLSTVAPLVIDGVTVLYALANVVNSDGQTYADENGVNQPRRSNRLGDAPPLMRAYTLLLGLIQSPA